MARQVIEIGIIIALPKFTCTADRQAKGAHFKEEFLVAKQSTIELNDVHKEVPFSNCVVDIVGKVEGFSFAIYFTHPNRRLPTELDVSSNQKVACSKLNSMIHTTCSNKRKLGLGN